MKEERKFNPASIDKLNDPARLERESPDLIWSELGLKDPRTLVDIGAGTGFFAFPFARKLTGGTVYACDLQKEMLDWMAGHLPADVKHSIALVQMEEVAVPLDSEIADLVYMINLHHELEDPVASLREARRLLKEGATLMVIDWKKAETPAGPPLHIRVDKDEIVQDMRDAGFGGIADHPVLPYHNFITARKRSDAHA